MKQRTTFHSLLSKIGFQVEIMPLRSKNGLKYDDIYEICHDPVTLQDWLRENGLIGDFEELCDVCLHGNIRLRKDNSYSKDGYVWRCTYKECNFKISIREGSWFAKSHLSLSDIVKLTYYWVNKQPNNLSEFELTLSCHTVVDWYSFAREVCTERVKRSSETVGGL